MPIEPAAASPSRKWRIVSREKNRVSGVEIEEAGDHERKEDEAEPELVEVEVAEDAEHDEREEAAGEEDAAHGAAELRPARRAA